MLQLIQLSSDLILARKMNFKLLSGRIDGRPGVFNLAQIRRNTRFSTKKHGLCLTSRKTPIIYENVETELFGLAAGRSIS